MTHMLNRGGLSLPTEMLCGVIDQSKRLPWTVDTREVTCPDCQRVLRVRRAIREETRDG